MYIRKFSVGLLIGWVALVGCSSNTPSSVAEVQNKAAAPVAAPKLPAIFGDNMVLQQGKTIPVWGSADAGQRVGVEFARQRKTATTGVDGKWMVKLDPVKAGGPYEMKVTVGDSASVGYKNVLVGEVWVCSGQSNMEMSLRGTSNAQEAIAAAGNPKIRLFTVSKAQAESPQIDCKGKWQECTAETVPGFSAVGYHFGREVQAALDVPVGLIHTSWGGTPVEAWMSGQVQQGDSDTKAVFAEYAQRQQVFDKAMADYQAATVKHKAEQERRRAKAKPLHRRRKSPVGRAGSPRFSTTP
ncbi:MAG: hypothetical protein NTU53_05470 [Planctomycetota bacterium]|nr:hypothetical protein [Planctomycetota bacterium]